MKVRAQLDLLGACLSRRADGRDRLAAAIDGGVPWPELLQRAGAHLVTPSLAGALAEGGLTAGLPEEVRAYLQTVRDLNRARNAVLYSELVRVVAALNAVGIEPQALKGAAALLPGQYPGAQDRVIGDLDLRVPAERYAVAADAILGLGYRCAADCARDPHDPGDDHHGAALLHPSAPVTVELHQRTLSNRGDNGRIEAAMTLRTVALPDAAARVQLADPGTRVLHNFLHGQINDRGHAKRCLDLRQLLDFVGLIGHNRPALDWPVLLARLRPHRRRVLRLHLLAAEHWLGEPYPQALGRPFGGAVALALTVLGQSSQSWYQLFGVLPRLGNLPARLFTPSWYPMKIRALRRGDPW